MARKPETNTAAYLQSTRSQYDPHDLAATTSPKNPADNRPALIDEGMLKHDYAHLIRDVAAVVAAADQNVPDVIEDEDDLAKVRDAVKALSGEAKRADALREDVKAPYLAAERVVQTFFKNIEAGALAKMAAIEARGTDFLRRKERRERERREEEARAQRERERIAAEEAAKKRREAEEAAQRQRDAEARAAEQKRQAEQAERDRLAAEQRARDEQDAEKRRAAETEAQAARERAEAETRKQREADEAADKQRRESDLFTSQAQAAGDRANQAASVTIEAERKANEKPAELARTRAGAGLATLAQSWDFEITDMAAVDLEALRPYVDKASLEKFVRAFVRVHKGDKELRGVRIFDKNKGRFT